MRLKNAGRMTKMPPRITVVTCRLRRMKLRVIGRERLQRGGDSEEKNDEEEKGVGDEKGDVLGHFDAHLDVRGQESANARADTAEDRLQLEDDVFAGHEAEEGDERVDNDVNELCDAETIELRLGDNEKTDPTS